MRDGVINWSLVFHAIGHAVTEAIWALMVAPARLGAVPPLVTEISAGAVRLTSGKFGLIVSRLR
jgi:hypothetical protein